MSSISSCRGLQTTRTNSRRERRSQSCLELQGRQILLASYSTLSLPPTTFHSRPQSQSSLSSPSPTAHSLSTQSLSGSRPTKSSRLRAHSAPVKYAEPDYKQIARRKKESELRTKSVTAEKILKSKIPEDQSLHSFLTGGRYNSAHHMDTRSLQRLGVYIPRNSSAKMFINPAGTIPPSSAVYGMYPLKKHLPLVVSSPSPSTLPTSSTDSCYSTNAHTDGALFLAEKDLDSCLKRDDTTSSCSLPSQQGSVDVDLSSHNGHHSTGGDVKVEEKEFQSGNTLECGEGWRKGEEVASKPVESSNVKGQRRTDVPYLLKEKGLDSSTILEAVGEEEGAGGDGSEASVVSDSDLLSPEAQLLTQEILLETESLCSTRSASGRIHKQKVNISFSTSHKAPSPNPPAKTARRELEEQSHQLKFKCESAQGHIEVSEEQKSKGRNVEATIPALAEHKRDNVLHQDMSTRPQSASFRRQGVDQRSDRSKRPQSAIQASQTEQLGIFVDLTKLHSMHTDNVTFDTNNTH